VRVARQLKAFAVGSFVTWNRDSLLISIATSACGQLWPAVIG
jgi:hypothetical protein